MVRSFPDWGPSGVTRTRTVPAAAASAEPSAKASVLIRPASMPQVPAPILLWEVARSALPEPVKLSQENRAAESTVPKAPAITSDLANSIGPRRQDDCR